VGLCLPLVVNEGAYPEGESAGTVSSNFHPGEMHLKISLAVEPLGKLPSTPGDSCDEWEIGPLAERFRFFPVVAGPGEHVASGFRPRRDDALVA
jgi:hypothetical protein